MKHIILIHSNITAISIFETVKSILNRGEKVIVLTKRNTVFAYQHPKMEKIDLSNFYKKGLLDFRTLKFYNILQKSLRYRFYLEEIDKFTKELVHNEDFLLYVPVYMDDNVKSLVSNRHCKGYYYIEEGTLDYQPLDYLYKISCKSIQAYLKKVILPLLGGSFHFLLEVNPKFKGTIGLFNEAFSWNTKWDKIVNSPIEYIEMQKLRPYDIIIVTGYLYANDEYILQAFNELFEKLDTNQSVAIKLHPLVFSQYPQKARRIRTLILQSYPNVSFLSNSYPVEGNILKFQTRIISFLEVSSLSLYSVLANTKSWLFCNLNGGFFLKEITSKEQFLSLTHLKY